MEDDIEEIIEQQRQLADHRYQAFMTNPDFRDADGQHEERLIPGLETIELDPDEPY